MLDWKKFEDEVPTEPRSVLVLAEDEHSNVDWSTATLDVRRHRNGNWDWFRVTCEVHNVGSCEDSVNAASPGEWETFREDTGYTHWAYVNPPEKA
jgi:hypothetical protein